MDVARESDRQSGGENGEESDGRVIGKAIEKAIRKTGFSKEIYRISLRDSASRASGCDV